jgi:hypothetical protein
MKSRAALSRIALAPGATAPRNKRNLRTAINADCSGLSFLRLSFASLIIGVFFMVVQLHAYVVWLRGGEKALLLVAVIASCIAVYVNDRIRRNSQDGKREIGQVYWILTLSLVTLLVIYLTISEPSPISLQYAGFDEVPGARRLKLEGVAIIFLILAPFGGALAGVPIERISRHLPIYITVFCILGLLGRSLSFVYYTCGADFPHTLLPCHGLGISDIGGITLNAIHAIQKGLNPYTADIQDGWTHDPYRGYRYWPMMFATYMPVASFFTTSWGAMRLTNFALDVITAALIFVLVCRRSGWLCGVLAASLYLMLPMLPTRLYQMVDTDLAPTVLLLAALALYQTRSGLAGVMVGLSVCAKFLPGLLMLVCCLPEFHRSRYVGGFVLGLIPAIAFCLLAPLDFINNTVWWGVASSSIDISSWLYGAPSYMIRATQLAFILLIAAVSFVMISRPPDLFERCALYVVCVAALLLASRAHNNYMMWWIPFFCILLSSPLSRILSLPGSLSNVAASGRKTL